jgi:SAM-dependent methyltransferase
VTDRLYELLTCPSCGASPGPGSERCPGCNRSVRGRSGGLDLLDDDLRAAADRFAAQYEALRRLEGWTTSGREDPDGGQPQLWKGRLRSVSEAASMLRHEWPSGSQPLVADIGSGGGWAARYLPPAEVLACDLLDVCPGSATVTVRADMRQLPIRSATLDAVLYAASLHYAPVEIAVSEAARVLRTRGLLVAVDSPIYQDQRSQTQAVARTAAYYSRVGYPELADHYHPMGSIALRKALAECGFAIERFEIGSKPHLFSRFRRRQPTSLVVARRTR